MKYEDQSVYDLRLFIIENKLDMSQFTILNSGKCGDFPYARAYVIGESHVITYHTQDFMFHEVFACIELEKESKLAYYGTLKTVTGKIELDFGLLNYTFEAEVLSWDFQVNNVSEKISESKPDVKVEFEFPKGDLKQSPITSILLYEKNNSIKIKTVHSYPNEGKVVLTHSELY